MCLHLFSSLLIADCTMNTDLVSVGVGFGIRNGLDYWQWSWKGMRQPSRPTVPLYRRKRPASCHRCALRNKPFIQPMFSWVNCPNQAGKAYRTRDTTTAWRHARQSQCVILGLSEDDDESSLFGVSAITSPDRTGAKVYYQSGPWRRHSPLAANVHASH